jgi:Zn-finger nucleic acid-binding protein
MTERQGVEIDYCPKCRGVWLDRGELDKIVERAERPDSSEYRSKHDRGRSNDDWDDDRDDDDDDDDRRRERPGATPTRQSGQKPARRSWLSDIFE